MWHRAAIVVASTILVIGGSAAVLRAIDFRQPDFIAQVPPMRDRPGRGEMGLLRELNLSADQMNQIQQIRSRNREQLNRDRDAARQAQQELRTLMAGTATDEQIRDKFRQVKDLRTKIADAQFNNMLEIRNVLNPEQRRRFADRMEKRRGGMRDRSPERIPAP